MTSRITRITFMASSLIIASFLTACGDKKPTSTTDTITPTPSVEISTPKTTAETKAITEAVTEESTTHTVANTIDTSDIFSGYATQKIADHTYVIHGPTEIPNPKNKGFMNNPGFIITDKSVIVIDPGSSRQIGQALLARIKEVTSNPITHVFATHVHGDHWLGNHAIKNAYPKAAFYAHPNMIEKANNGEADMWIKNMHALTEGATEGTKAIIPNQESTHESSKTVDNMTIKTHFIEKAHSNTDIMLEIVEDKVLFTGDNITYTRLPRMRDGTFKGNIAAADYALTLNIKHVVPGHGPSGGKEILQSYRNYLSTVYENTKILMEEDLEPFEMKAQIVKKLANYKDWSGFEEQIGKHIGLAALEIEADF
ncbi:MAG TPA: MBL fold metallo-hydrolase [Thiothrix sp.]|nr:MBL fold metallo-hydrolase [Thiothrix sp.]